MIKEWIRSKIGSIILYFISGTFTSPIALNKNDNYLFTVNFNEDDSQLDAQLEALRIALSTVITGEIVLLNGVKLNIMGLADENKDKH